MKKIALLICLSLLVGYTTNISGQVIYSEDFESATVGNITTTTTVWPHNIDNGGIFCGAVDAWRIDNDGLFVATPYQCTGCVNQYAEIEYDNILQCNQDATLVLGQFASTTGNILIQFDFSYLDFSGTDNFTVTLYNATTATTAATLLAYTNTSAQGQYSSFQAVTIGQNYELRFHYVGTDDIGAAVDNVLVQEVCGPDITYTFTCQGDLSVDVDLDITALNGATAIDVFTGSTTYLNNVGLGSYTITGLDTLGIYIADANNHSCGFWLQLPTCDPCNTVSTPSDDCASAPLLNLSQPFFGSTECGYTPTNDGSGTDVNGPDAHCGSIENDSWLQFIAGDDSVQLDWEITGGSNCNNGVQFAVFDGVCTNYDGMVALACYDAFSGTGIGDMGSFVIPGLTVGQSYYLYIDGWAGDLCDYSWTPVSGVSLLPQCDTCQNTCELVCGGADTADIIQATAFDAPAACGGGGTPGKGVWYVFTGDGSNMTISTDHTQTNFDTQINVYTGVCGALTCIGGDDDSGTGNTSELTVSTSVGIIYYIYVDGDGAAEGTFVIDLTCSPCNADAGAWD